MLLRAGRRRAKASSPWRGDWPNSVAAKRQVSGALYSMATAYPSPRRQRVCDPEIRPADNGSPIRDASCRLAPDRESD